MNSDFQVLIDSDAFVGRIVEFDAHHQRASSVFQSLEKERVSVVTTSLVVVETATVISNRVGQALARAFLKVVKDAHLPIIHIDEALQQKALMVFADQTKKGTSVVDCANVAVMRKFHIPRIFSFDKVYPKSFKLHTLT